ncbi:hypothetical protein JCM8097_005544 [Rhodosporidiobolus ruineniae]
MPRSRRDRSPSSSSKEDSSGSSGWRRPPSRSRRRPAASRNSGETRSYRSMGKRRADWDDWPPRYEDGGTSTDDSWSSRSSSSSDSEDPGHSRSSRPPDSAAATAQQQQTKRCLVLFLGAAVVICIVLLGAFALVKYFGNGSLSGGSSGTGSSGGGATTHLVTVTVTTDGKVSTKVSTETAAAASTAAKATSTGSSSSGNSSSSGSGIAPGISKNNIGIGFLPDYTNQKMSDITSGLGLKSSFYGWYAQLPSSGDWDGSQLTSQMDDIKACNCIFQPAVMPTKGWAGLTESDNSQALAIAKVMKQFTDEGIEVWLRFAHEVNYYTTDGTYQGDADDFKAGWAAVAAAVADNDKVKMFFTPNVAGSLDDYVSWMPDDTSTIDYLGIDYYPKSSSESFLDHMQPLYDKYCSDGSIKFAIGETGQGWKGSIDERLAWLDQCTNEATAKAMPHYVGVSWFNYNKEQEFRLFIADDSSTNDVSKTWFSDGTVASGATLGNG